jgi:RNA-directed DNA polymerase
MGGWAVAQSPILITTITLERLRKRGYISMLSLYQEVSLNNYKNSLFPMF